jgi:indolepyruvate ferredoxin oxidoreductase beta subunit
MVGVGGQGTILASELLSHVLMMAGYDVKKSEVHGMSQRGGRVESHVRFGPTVDSPLIVKGEADYLVGFEMSETLRSLDWLSPAATVIAENRSILPYTAQVGQAEYPFDSLQQMADAGFNLKVIEGDELAIQAGEPKTANVVLMGALAKSLDVDRKVWAEAISSNMPERFVAVNLKAFDLGYGEG